ncbi:PPR1 [Candida theae]|uniref:PPR1 n=1 Tax=Candida theae TaxID=1198502 RepID=A0AAD5BBV9_9ASCO|nr:PPR1 [Candida theae]KAI5950368.1 PPR1 [Candida theae]
MTHPSTKKQKTKASSSSSPLGPPLESTSLNSDSHGSSTGRSQTVKISRAISACKRCRTKKIKCDQKFPQCGKCAQHNVECMGLDPITGREIPRSYIVHLEERVKFLEGKLSELGGRSDAHVSADTEVYVSENGRETSNNNDFITLGDSEKVVADNGWTAQSITENGNKSHAHSLESDKSGKKGSNKISFSKLMSTAVKVQKRHEKSADDDITSKDEEDQDPRANVDADGLSDDELKQAAVLPPKSTALQFCQIFFHQCNPQFPIMHREEFIRDYFIPIYGPLESSRFQFASNDGSVNASFWESDFNDGGEGGYWFDEYKSQFQQLLTKENESNSANNNIDIRAISNTIVPPRRFHVPLFFLNMVFAIASSVHHLKYPSQISESFRLAAMKYYNVVKRNIDQLMALQGILLYAFYSIMRPTNPGVWYIMGEALRMCVDLDLQNELKTKSRQNMNIDGYTRDKRRRIFWCTYSIDRQICFYLDRPFGIPDESINTPLLSVWDDSKIYTHDSIMDYTKLSNDEGFIGDVVSYKNVSLAFITIRQLQSEVTKILYTGAELPRRYTDLSQWKGDILARLTHWYQNLPTPKQMNCNFNPIFFHLNYHHTLLYIHGLGPRNYNLTMDDIRQVSISAKEVINCYTQLYLTKSVNYTWAAVHNLFMAGTSYLYSLYNSDEIRAMNPINTVMLSCSNCLKILSSLIDKCDAAQYCCEIFQNLTLVIVKLKYPNESINQFMSGSGSKRQGEIGEHGRKNGSDVDVSAANGEGAGDKGETKVSRESLYRINNGNVHSNLFQLVNELDHLNPLTKSSPQSVGTRGDQLSQHQSPQGSHSQHQNRSPHHQEDNHHNAGGSQNVVVTSSEFAHGFEYPDWNDEELDFFFQELNHNNQVVGTATTTGTVSDKSTPPPPVDGTHLDGTQVSEPPHFPIHQHHQQQHPHHSPTYSSEFPPQLGSSLHARSSNTREGRRTFELMHNAPTEKIWEEFFTSK